MGFLEPYELEEMGNVIGWDAICTGNTQKVSPCYVVTAGENLTKGQAVYINSDQKAYKASNSNDSTMPCVGFVYKDATAGNDVWIQFDGKAALFSGLTVGSKYFVGTSGGITATRPTGSSIVQCVGVAVSSTTLLLVPLGCDFASTRTAEVGGLHIVDADDNFGTAQVDDADASQSDPSAMTSTAVTYSDAVAITYGDADLTYDSNERDLINDLKSKYNSLVPLVNEIKSDYNALRADVTALHSVLIGTIDYCDALKSKINELLGELRKTGGCGVLSD